MKHFKLIGERTTLEFDIPDNQVIIFIAITTFEYFTKFFIPIFMTCHIYAYIKGITYIGIIMPIIMPIIYEQKTVKIKATQEVTAPKSLIISDYVCQACL